MTLKTTAKTLCVVGTKGTLSPWTMEAVDDAAAVKGTEWGDHFWTCRRPR
jgi:hypothetical protein